MIFIGIIISLGKPTKFDFFFIIIAISLLVNFMSASYFRDQDMLVSLKTSLFLVQIFFYYFLVAYNASVKSVENYRSRICKKLNLDARNNSLLLWVLDNKKIIDGIK